MWDEDEEQTIGDWSDGCGEPVDEPTEQVGSTSNE